MQEKVPVHKFYSICSTREKVPNCDSMCPVANETRLYVKKSVEESLMKKFDILVWEWYCERIKLGEIPSNDILKNKAIEIAANIGLKQYEIQNQLAAYFGRHKHKSRNASKEKNKQSVVYKRPHAQHLKTYIFAETRF